MCFFASGGNVSIVPIFRQFCACLSDGNGASFGMIARYGVSFRCRYTSYIPFSLVEATSGVIRPRRGASFLQLLRINAAKICVILCTEATRTAGHLREIVSTILARPDEESRTGGLQMVFPPHLTRKRKQIGRQGNHCWRA